MLALSIVLISMAGSVEKAAMLEEHGLLDDAKREFIEVIFSNDPASAKAEAYYRLGNIAVQQDNTSAAMSAWNALVEKYPKSDQATRVAERIKVLAEALQQTLSSHVDDATAQGYIRNAEFWSREKSDRFTIDSSWLPKIEMAVGWYDRVIKEFPNSAASRVAYEQKLKTLLGWKDGGRAGTGYGVEVDYPRYMPQVIATFAAFEKEHPKASSLQAFRFQIAQAHWGKAMEIEIRGGRSDAGDGYLRDATALLKAIVANDPDNNSFYRDLAERRLANMHPRR